MSLCQYQNIFGEVGKGVHSIRIFNFAVVDLALTAVAAYFLARWRNWNILATFGGLMLVGVIAHWLFCVDTRLNTLLGLARNN